MENMKALSGLNSANPEHCGACFLEPYCREQSGCMAHDIAAEMERLRFERDTLKTENIGLKQLLDMAVNDIMAMNKQKCLVCHKKDACEIANTDEAVKADCLEWHGLVNHKGTRRKI